MTHKPDLAWYDYTPHCNTNNTEAIASNTDTNENIPDYTESALNADNSNNNDINFES